ncbi:PGAP1-like protein [Ditylenchus destructor]|nr:PGAP1-like protein [Ditylenchus destructor]
MRRQFWQIGGSTCGAISLGLSWLSWKREISVSSPHFAPLEMLEKSQTYTEFARHISEQKETRGLGNDEEYLKSFLRKKFDTETWCRLALEENDILDFFEPKFKWDNSSQNKDVFTLFHELQLDKGWDSALSWYFHKFCAEEDLACQEASPVEVSSSKKERLLKLLPMLLYRSQMESCKILVEEGVVYALLRLLKDLRQESKQISLMGLKILANIAQNSREGALQICESELLQLLSSMIRNPMYEEESVLAHKICVNSLHSMEASSYELSPDIYELHRPKDQVSPALDIVFVHGLRGTAFRTWRQKEKLGMKTTLFWPKEWLAKDTPVPVRILALDYSSRLLRFGEVMETIHSRSSRFVQEFLNAGIGTRPVVFICHSMGGLLVKNMLIDSKELREKTVGILFMATPHRGSAVASTYSYSVLRPSDDLRLLSLDSVINQELHSKFMEIANEIPIFVSILETQNSSVLGSQRIIVPQESAYFESATTYHLPLSHHEVCKPESRESASYRIVQNFVRDALRRIEKT